MTKYIRLPLLLLTVLLALGAFTPAWAAQNQDDLALQTAPAAIEMNTFYNGMDLTVTGRIPAGDDLVLRFTGAPEEEHLREKGKAFGLLWMNVGKVALANVPKVLIVQSSKPLAELGQAGHALSLDGLHDSIAVVEAGSQDIDATSELVKLKRGEHLYSEASGTVEFAAEQDGMTPFTATLAVPSKLTTGEYKVEAYALKDGVIAAQASLPVEARLTGIPAWLAAMAFDHGTLYGVLAVVIAILAGLAIGLVFQSKGAH